MIRRILIAIGVACAATALALPAANAEPMPHTSGNAVRASGPNATCPKASVHSTQTGIASFESSSTAGPCTVQLSSWSVPDTYDGKGYDASARPQVLVDRTVATLGVDAKSVSVKVPASRWCQIDYRAANGTYLYGRIVECHPAIKPTPTPTPTATVTGGVPVTHKPTPKASKTPDARVRIVQASAELPRTGGASWMLAIVGGWAIACGLALRFARFTRAARRH